MAGGKSIGGSWKRERRRIKGITRGRIVRKKRERYLEQYVLPYWQSYLPLRVNSHLRLPHDLFNSFFFSTFFSIPPLRLSSLFSSKSSSLFCLFMFDCSSSFSSLCHIFTSHQRFIYSLHSFNEWSTHTVQSSASSMTRRCLSSLVLRSSFSE